MSTGILQGPYHCTHRASAINIELSVYKIDSMKHQNHDLNFFVVLQFISPVTVCCKDIDNNCLCSNWQAILSFVIFRNNILKWNSPDFRIDWNLKNRVLDILTERLRF